MAAWIRQAIGTSSPGERESLATWRERLVSLLLLGMAAAVLPFGFAALSAAVRAGQPARAVLYLGAYSLVIVMALAPHRFPYLARAGMLLTALFFLGVGSLLTTGLSGSGRMILIAFSVAAALVFAWRGGLIAVAIVSAAYVSVGWRIAQGDFPSTIPAADVVSGEWGPGGVSALLVGGALVAVVGWVHSRLALSFRREQELLDRSEMERAGLEIRVAEGTRGLMRQALQLKTAAEIARLASQKLDPHELLLRAVELIPEHFGFYHASVFLLEETGTWAELSASTGDVGRSLHQRNYRLAVGSASLIGWVTANKLTRLALDVEQDPFYFRNPQLPDTRAELAVPLLIGDRLLGALDVQSFEPQAFTPDDVRAMEAIASELAVALDSARQLKAARGQLEEAEGIVRGRVHASWDRLSRQQLPEILRIGPSGEVVVGASVPLPLMTEAELAVRRVVSEDGHEMAVPIVIRGEVVATLGARRSEEENRWSEDDLALIEAIAAQAALALENARQTAEEQRRLVELEVLNRVSQAVSQMLRLDSLLKVVHTQINQILGDVSLTYAFYDSVTGELTRPYVGTLGEVKSMPAQPLGDDLFSYLIRTQTPLRLGSRLSARAAELGVRIDEPDLRSWLGVPMLVGEDVVGAIAVDDQKREDRFTEDDSSLLLTIASQVASAFQNARLLEQVQRSARRERLIREISTKVRRSPDLRSILETTTRELARALNATKATIQLGAGDGDGRGEERKSGGGEPGSDPEKVRT